MVGKWRKKVVEIGVFGNLMVIFFQGQVTFWASCRSPWVHLPLTRLNIYPKECHVCVLQLVKLSEVQLWLALSFEELSDDWMPYVCGHLENGYPRLLSDPEKYAGFLEILPIYYSLCEGSTWRAFSNVVFLCNSACGIFWWTQVSPDLGTFEHWEWTVNLSRKSHEPHSVYLHWNFIRFNMNILFHY